MPTLITFAFFLFSNTLLTFISINLIQVIKNLYNQATSVVLFNSSIGDWFRTTVGVRQGCLLSHTLFNVFLERIMTDAVEDHEGPVSVGGRTITNLRFADDIDGFIIIIIIINPLTAMIVWAPQMTLQPDFSISSCFPFIRSGQNHLARHSERGKKTRRTKEEVGR